MYQNTVESLARFLARNGRLKPAFKARLASVGLNIDQPTDVSQTVWVAALAVSVDELFPGIEPYEAQRRLGNGLVGAFVESTVGKILFTTARILGVKRGLSRMTGNFRSANNFTEVDYLELGPGDGRITVSDVNGAPGYFQGVLETAIRAVGAVDLEISCEREHSPGCTYRLRWK